MSNSAVRCFGVVTALGLTAALVGTSWPAAATDQKETRHVLLLSVDGMHQADLARFVEGHPESALASLVAGGVEFTNA